RHPRPRLSPLDRAFWVALSRFWPGWRGALVVVRPETVIRWYRKAFRGYWRWISKPGPGRPSIPEEIKDLDRPDGDGERLACPKDPGRVVEARNPPRLDDDLPLLAEGHPDVDPHQRWMTFLRNHRDWIAGMESIPSERHSKVLGRMGPRNVSWERSVASCSIRW